MPLVWQVGGASGATARKLRGLGQHSRGPFIRFPEILCGLRQAVVSFLSNDAKPQVSVVGITPAVEMIDIVNELFV